jgi:hypothetical protein
MYWLLAMLEQCAHIGEPIYTQITNSATPHIHIPHIPGRACPDMGGPPSPPPPVLMPVLCRVIPLFNRNPKYL